MYCSFREGRGTNQAYVRAPSLIRQPSPRPPFRHFGGISPKAKRQPAPGPTRCCAYLRVANLFPLQKAQKKNIWCRKVAEKMMSQSSAFHIIMDLPRTKLRQPDFCSVFAPYTPHAPRPDRPRDMNWTVPLRRTFCGRCSGLVLKSVQIKKIAIKMIARQSTTRKHKSQRLF